MVLLVTARHVVPAVGQSLVVAMQVPLAFASQRQMGRQVFVPDIWLQISPGAQSAAWAQAWPSSLVRVASGQAQSTWSIAAGITQAVYPVSQDLKASLLVELLRRKILQQALVFTRTKHRANRLADFLGQQGVNAARIHGSS